MTCSITSTAGAAASLRAQAEGLCQAHAAAVSRGDAARGKALWTLFRDVEFRAYLAEREVEREELMARYPSVTDLFHTPGHEPAGRCVPGWHAQ